jgi:hypothetical protein
MVLVATKPTAHHTPISAARSGVASVVAPEKTPVIDRDAAPATSPGRLC